MNEAENQPQMTEWDKQTIAHLNDLVELDKAGKLEFFPIEQVFANVKKLLLQYESRMKQCTCPHKYLYKQHLGQNSK